MSDGWRECPRCGGDIPLFSGQEEEFGRVWTMYTGRCRSCGQTYTEVAPGQRAEYMKLREKAEKEEIDRTIEEERRAEMEYRASLTPEELLNYLGPERYPWTYLVLEGVAGPDGKYPITDLPHTYHCLTPESAHVTATLYLRPGEHCRIEQKHKVLDEWTYGDRPFERFTVSVHHDYIIHDTGAVAESRSCGIRELTLDKAISKAEKDADGWLSRTATFYHYWIKDKDGNLVYEKLRTAPEVSA